MQINSIFKSIFHFKETRNFKWYILDLVDIKKKMMQKSYQSTCAQNCTFSLKQNIEDTYMYHFLSNFFIQFLSWLWVSSGWIAVSDFSWDGQAWVQVCFTLAAL